MTSLAGNPPINSADTDLSHVVRGADCWGCCSPTISHVLTRPAARADAPVTVGLARMSDLSIRLRPVVEADLDMFRRFAHRTRASSASTGPASATPQARPAGSPTTATSARTTGGSWSRSSRTAVAAGFVSYVAGRYGGPVATGRSASPCCRDWRGRGIGWRAQAMLCDYLFAHTPVQRIQAGTHPENIAEQKSLEKAGFLLRASSGPASSAPASGATATCTAASAPTRPRRSSRAGSAGRSAPACCRRRSGPRAVRGRSRPHRRRSGPRRSPRRSPGRPSARWCRSAGVQQRPVERQAAVGAQRHVGFGLEARDHLDRIAGLDGRVRPVERLGQPAWRAP